MTLKWILGAYKGSAREDVIGAFGVWLGFRIPVRALGTLLGNRGCSWTSLLN